MTAVTDSGSCFEERGAKMTEQMKRILVSAGVFITVVLIMSLTAGFMRRDDINASGGETPEINSEQNLNASDKTGAEDSGAFDGQKDNAAEVQDSNGQDSGAEDTEEKDGASAESGGQDDLTAGAEGNGKDAAVVAPGDEKPDGEGESGDSTEADAAGNGRHVIAINAGHQLKADTGTEPIGPGADETKIKVSWGATGVASGTPEYKLNLEVAKKLRDELNARGYEVYMIRDSSDVSITDAERAKLANENAEIVIHIHSNADDRPEIKGIMAFYPSDKNPYVSKLSAECRNLGNAILSCMELATSAKNWGTIAHDKLTHLNWTEIPSIHLEIGYLTNKDEDLLLQTEEYQNTIVAGIAEGIELYFGE